MTAKFAEGTEVSPGKSRDDIERILSRYGLVVAFILALGAGS